MFLTPEEIIHLTGISRGRGGRTREQLQAEQLRRMGIAFRVNARGKPVITWAAVNGVESRQAESPTTWRSNVLKFN